MTNAAFSDYPAQRGAAPKPYWSRLELSGPSCEAPAPKGVGWAPFGADACCDGSVAELLRNLGSTRVCPAVYRRALQQGALPLDAPRLLAGWCELRPCPEANAPQARSWGRAAGGLREGLRAALAGLRSRPMFAP